MRKLVALPLLALIAVPVYCGPTYYQYDLGALGVANADADVPFGPGWYGMWGGDKFTKGNITVPFGSPGKTSDSTLNNNPNTQSVPFTISTNGKESWSGFQAVKDGSQAGNAPVSVDLPGTVANPGAIFLMMNTFWGSTSPSVQIVLQFANSPSLTFDLRGNTDIRDHNDSGVQLGRPAIWTTQINSNLRDSGNGQSQATVNDETYSFQYDGSQHLVYRDVVGLFLDPAYHADTLTMIRILDWGANDTSPTNPNASRVWLWGASVAVVAMPEPSTWMMLATGLGLIGLRLCRR